MLAEISEKQINERPEWLTPYLFAGVAYAKMGQRDIAIRKLQYVSEKSAGLKEYADADRFLKILNAQGK